MEIWKDIIWYEWLYKISNLWRVKSLERKRYNNHNKTYSVYKEKILKPRPTWRDRNYSAVMLYKNWVWSKKPIHRLVAQAFLWLDIDNKKILSLHRNEELDNQWLLNNSVDNLWLWTYSDNTKDCVKKWRHKRWRHEKH